MRSPRSAPTACPDRREPRDGPRRDPLCKRRGYVARVRTAPPLRGTRAPRSPGAGPRSFRRIAAPRKPRGAGTPPQRARAPSSYESRCRPAADCPTIVITSSAAALLRQSSSSRWTASCCSCSSMSAPVDGARSRGAWRLLGRRTDSPVEARSDWLRLVLRRGERHGCRRPRFVVCLPRSGCIGDRSGVSIDRPRRRSAGVRAGPGSPSSRCGCSVVRSGRLGWTRCGPSR
jgi:hypothetical protein